MVLENSIETAPLTQQSSRTSYQSFSSNTYDRTGSSSSWDVEIDVKNQVNTGITDENEPFSWKKLLKYTGPGWLMAIAYLDPGNLESDLQAGSIAGYKLLWLLFWCHVAGLAIQTLAIRLGVVTGKHLAQHVRQSYNRPTGIIIWMFTQSAIIGSDIQEIVGTAIALRIIFGFSIWVGVLITATDTFLFMFLQQYGVRKIELFFITLIAIMICCFWIEMISSGPDISLILEGMVIPEIPSNAAVQAVGMIGCLLMPHDMFLHSALVGSRNLGTQPSIAKKKEANFYFTLESGLALLTSYFINLSIVVVFAQVFYQPGKTITQLPGLYDAAEVLQRSLGGFARYLWAAGLLAAGQSSTMTGTLAGQYVMEGFFGAFFKKQWHRVAITRAIALIPSMLVAVLAVDRFDTMGEILNVIQSLCLPMAVIPLLKLTSSSDIMTKQFKNTRTLDYICWSISWIVIGFNAYAFLTFIESFGFSLILTGFSIAYFGFIAYLVYSPLSSCEALIK
ncbi:natural resistance-associated macrophage protein-domain-containing protein [Halteromyces radiatus]|uniref:natural resistance-associated macrophage protein-domain-containing protein n=1 Tax=Halteromyces radiatus TaxID=101107 RepID=UPI00221E761B|nr:natural resistance-associated macrophage protein-domain-containing protein [Halteromyces radiatus]KAI8088653.1 natural resistance-associated macrophage protein-domain-containing protein [Halteromyces radiatus]